MPRSNNPGYLRLPDYITGWSGGVLGAENDFYDLVEAASPFTYTNRLDADSYSSST
jgi:hypothetical protein